MTADEYQPVRVSRRIEAPAADIFRVLADPRRHLEIDGSGMLRGAVADAAVTGVGDVFTMRMYYSEHGDYEIGHPPPSAGRTPIAGPGARTGRGRQREQYRASGAAASNRAGMAAAQPSHSPYRPLASRPSASSVSASARRAATVRRSSLRTFRSPGLPSGASAAVAAAAEAASW